MSEGKNAGNKPVRRIAYSAVMGLITGMCLTFGYFERTKESLPVAAFPFWLMLIGISAGAGILTFFLLGRKKKDAPVKETKARFGLLAACFALMMVLWLIQLWGIYPGFFNYDAPSQWEMYAQSAVTAHHPVLHTYFIGKCLHLSYIVFKSPLPGCALYLMVQMLICAFAYTKAIAYCLGKKLPAVFAVFAALWAALAPTVVMCVLSVTKDSMFTPFLILFIVQTLEFIEGRLKKWPQILLWCVSAFFAAILRNNALYIMIPFFLFLVIRFRKQKEAYSLLGVIAALVIYLGPVTSAITVDGVSEGEFLSVPIQQVMRVYHLHRDELKEEEIKAIEASFEQDALIVYFPTIADVAKFSLKKDYFDAHRKEMISLWTDLGKRFPGEYVNAFLIGNEGFWDPFKPLTLTADGGEGYYVCRSYEPVWNESKIPAIYSYYKHFENARIITSKPLTMWIFAPATYFFLFLYTLVRLLYQRRKEACVLVPVLLIWLTFLLGPVALVRYVGFLYAMVPLEIGLIAGHFKEKESNEQ